MTALVNCWGNDPITFDGDFFHIPPRITRPEPIPRPRPRLLSGMRSEAGLERTARLFGIWNPSRGTAADGAASAARIDAMRMPAG